MRKTLQRVSHWALLRTWDPMVNDRWRWLSRHLGPTRGAEPLLDIGCGAGSFTIGAALRGYDAVGLTWSAADRDRATRRAERIGARARFVQLDARELDTASHLKGAFSVVISCEVIEHLLDDRRFLRAAAGCLKPGGRLLLTTPNVDYRAIVSEHDGPFSLVEDGGHVRRGYKREELVKMCEQSGLRVTEVDSCSGFVSQKATWVTYTAGRVNPNLARILTAPLHPIASWFDVPVTRMVNWPPYSLCVVAEKTGDSDRDATRASDIGA